MGGRSYWPNTEPATSHQLTSRGWSASNLPATEGAVEGILVEIEDK